MRVTAKLGVAQAEASVQVSCTPQFPSLAAMTFAGSLKPVVADTMSDAADTLGVATASTRYSWVCVGESPVS